MSIKTVVFDFGGVISFMPTPEMRSEIVRLSGLSEEVLWGLDRKFRGEWDRGSYNGKEHYRFILAKEGVSLNEESLAKIVKTDIESWSHINPDTIKLLRDIKAVGLRVGILSNIPHDFPRSSMPVFAEADFAVYSCELGFIKPEAEIYENLRDKAGCPYEEIVFFDDKVDNVNKARELGIRAFLWEGAGKAREIVSELTGAAL